MAKVDILLTYWGDFKLLKKTVESVFAQTTKDWRLVVMDDHYPTLDAKEYFATIHDPRVTYIRHKQNIGITKNFNFSIDQALSKYCVLLGCDDIILPNYLERALSTIGDADFYQPGVDIIDGDGTTYAPLVDKIKYMLRPKKPGLYKGQKLATSLCFGNWLYFPSLLWKTATLKKYRFNENFKVVEDVQLEFELITNGCTLYLDNETTFQYRRFASSVSSKEKKRGGIRFNEEDAVYDAFALKFREMGWHSTAFVAKTRPISRIHRLVS